MNLQVKWYTIVETTKESENRGSQALFLIGKRKPSERVRKSMKTLETNDWMILNSLIYKIYTTEDMQVMRRQFLEQMKMVLDFDSADFYLTDGGEKHKLIQPVTYNSEEDQSASYGELGSSRGIMYSGKSMVYRETDIISDEKRVESEYYQKIYRPNNWHYSLRMILGYDKAFLGIVTFYRTIGKDNYHYNDIFLLDILKDHLAYRLYSNQKETVDGKEKLTVSQAAEQYGLTKREHMILKMLLQGLDNDRLCEELSISVNTLKKHILNIYRKLGIKNRVQMFKMIKERE